MQVSSQDTLVAPFMALFAEHHDVAGAPLAALLAAAPPPTRSAAVFAVQQFITLRLYTQRALDNAIAAAADLLALLHAANAVAARPIMHEEFYNDVVNSADFDLGEDYRRFVAARPSRPGQLFSFCRCARNAPSLRMCYELMLLSAAATGLTCSCASCHARMTAGNACLRRARQAA